MSSDSESVNLYRNQEPRRKKAEDLRRPSPPRPSPAPHFAAWTYDVPGCAHSELAAVGSDLTGALFQKVLRDLEHAPRMCDWTQEIVSFEMPSPPVICKPLRRVSPPPSALTRSLYDRLDRLLAEKEKGDVSKDVEITELFGQLREEQRSRARQLRETVLSSLQSPSDADEVLAQADDLLRRSAELAPKGEGRGKR